MPIIEHASGGEAEKGPEKERKPKDEEKADVGSFEEEYPLSLAETSAFLRELADTLDRGGTVEMGLSQQKIQLHPEEPITLEISYKEDQKKKKLEVELEIEEHFGAAGREGGRPTVR